MQSMRTHATRYRRFFDRATRLLYWLCAGLVVVFAAARLVYPQEVWRDLFNAGLFAASSLALILSLFFDRNQSNAKLNDLRPARAALIVIMLCGIAAAFFFGSQFNSYVVTFGLMILTGIAAAAAYRFAERHAEQIGEARFDTRNPNEN